jgi:hypothetical protein
MFSLACNSFKISRFGIGCLAALVMPGVATMSLVAGDDLKIVVLEGENATNSVRTRTGSRIVVEVRDQNDRPLAGAEVVFQLPSSGPGGHFPGFESTRKTTTTRQGQAAMVGWIPNDQLGRFQIEVTAVSGPRSGRIRVTHTNTETIVMPVKKGSSIWKVLIPVAGSGAAAGILATTLRGSSASGPPPNSLTVTPSLSGIAGPR